MERASKRGSGSLFLDAQHQLRQPLNAISLLIGELRDATEGRDRAAIVDDMRYAVQLSNAWLDSLTDLEKAEQGLLQPQVQGVPLHQVFARLQDDFAGHFARLGLDFRVVDSRAVVLGDAAILRRLLALLLDNAAKFTRQGKVLLGCRHQDSRLRIEVWDSGPGVAEGDKDRLFEAFYRLENEVRPHERGLGLGLTYARRLCDIAGYELTLSSSPGRGSCFALTLRRAEPAQPSAAARQGVAAGEEAANAAGRAREADLETSDSARPCEIPADPLVGARILLLAGAEATTLRASLEGWGAEVSQTTRETLGEALRAAPDLLLADQAALAEGEDLAPLRQSKGATALILLADSGHQRVDDAGLGADGAHLLERPIRPARLRSLCHYALTHRR